MNNIPGYFHILWLLKYRFLGSIFINHAVWQMSGFHTLQNSWQRGQTTKKLAFQAFKTAFFWLAVSRKHNIYTGSGRDWCCDDHIKDFALIDVIQNQEEQLK